MKKIIRNLALVLLIVFGFDAKSQVQFSCEAPNEVEVGEQFAVNFSVNARGKDLKQPDFIGFDLLGGPNVSSNSSIQIINGKTTSSSEYSYSFILQATKEGTYTINPASINVDGKVYSSRPVSVKVVKGQAIRQNRQQQQVQAQTQASSSSNVIGNDEIFIELSLNKYDVYVSEPIVATLKFYTLHDVTGFESVKLSSFNGFWSQELKVPELRQLKPERYKNRTYYTGLLKKVLLFPQKSGKIVIDPSELVCNIRQRVGGRSRGFFDDFFDSYQNVQKKIKTAPVTINVKTLPNSPSNFSGCVGSFSLSTNISKAKVKTNESITLKVLINGSGNIKLTEAPKFEFPTDFETYDPKIAENIETNESGMSGNKTFEYLLIPRHSGDYTIPSISYVYFDLGSRSFKTINTPEFRINVEKGSSEEYSGVVNSNSQKQDIKQVGTDIRYIKTNIFKNLKSKGELMINSFEYYLYYLIILCLFILYVIWKRKQISTNSNIAYVKNKRAKKLVDKRLKSAHIYLKANNKELFYNELLKALWGYVSDKFNLSTSELNRDNVAEKLRKNNANAELIKDIINFADECEFAHFSQSFGSVSMDEIYKKAEEVFMNVEQQVKVKSL